MRFGVVTERREYGHEHDAVFGLESGSNVRTAAPVVGKTVGRLGGLRGVRRGIKRALLRQNFAMNLQRRMAGRSAGAVAALLIFSDTGLLCAVWLDVPSKFGEARRSSD